MKALVKTACPVDHLELAGGICPLCLYVIDEYGNTEDDFRYCAKGNCGCDGPGCPMGGEIIECNINGGPKMDLNNKLLALQMLNGVKLYEVRVLGTGNLFRYKSRTAYHEGDVVVVQLKSYYSIGRVVKEVTDFDFAVIAEWKWILGQCFDPEAMQKEFDELDITAKQKIAQAQAMHEAKKLLEMSGLTLADLSILLGKPETEKGALYVAETERKV